MRKCAKIRASVLKLIKCFKNWGRVDKVKKTLKRRKKFENVASSIPKKRILLVYAVLEMRIFPQNDQFWEKLNKIQ